MSQWLAFVAEAYKNQQARGSKLAVSMTLFGMQTTQLLNECFIALANQSGLVSLDVFCDFLSSSRAGLC